MKTAQKTTAFVWLLASGFLIISCGCAESSTLTLSAAAEYQYQQPAQQYQQPAQQYQQPAQQYQQPAQQYQQPAQQYQQPAQQYQQPAQQYQQPAQQYQQPAQQQLPVNAQNQINFIIESPVQINKPITIADDKFKEYIVGTWNNQNVTLGYTVTKVNNQVITAENAAPVKTNYTIVFSPDGTLRWQTVTQNPQTGTNNSTEQNGRWMIKDGRLTLIVNIIKNAPAYNLNVDVIWLNQNSFILQYDQTSYTRMLDTISAQAQYPAGIQCTTKNSYYYGQSGSSYHLMQMQTISADGSVSNTECIFKSDKMLFTKGQTPTQAFAETSAFSPQMSMANSVPNQFANQQMQQPTMPNTMHTGAQPVPQHSTNDSIILRPIYALGRIISSPLNLVGFTVAECKKIKSNSSFAYAYIPFITIPAGVLAMGGDVIVGCLELLTLQKFNVRYPWDSFSPSKEQEAIIGFTKTLLSTTAVAAVQGAAAYSAARANANLNQSTTTTSTATTSQTSSSATTKTSKGRCTSCNGTGWLRWKTFRGPSFAGTTTYFYCNICEKETTKHTHARCTYCP